MQFRNWLVLEDMRGLARAYSDSLRDVPQDPDHHPEGSVLAHVKLVRRSIRAAAKELENLKNSPAFGDVLSGVDFSLNEEEMQILALAAWLHDVGKASATTVGGVHYLSAKDPGKIQAIGHENPEHYEPQIEKLISLAPDSLVKFYDAHRETINFLIERHMDFAQGGFSKNLVLHHFEDGRLKDDPRMKLLLVLMWADKLGRGKVANLSGNIDKLRAASERSKAQRQKDPFSGSEQEFRDMLRSRGLSDNAIDAAVRAKFG